MVLVQKQNYTSWCLKLHVSVSQFFGTERTHTRIHGLKGEALFLKLLSFFGVSADCRLVQIRKYKFVISEFTYINFYLNSLFYTILYVQNCTY
jgi:hypothetical protein